MRLLLAAVSGAAVASGGAVVLGDYPLSGSVPWVAAVILPLIVVAPMALVDRPHTTVLWAAAGPLSALAFAWGVRIATGWGLDPVPSTCWVAGGLALVWPVAVGVTLRRRARRPAATAGPR